MAKPYSDDLRARVTASIEEGATRPEAAEQHHVSLSSVGRFLWRKRETLPDRDDRKSRRDQ